MLAPIASLLCFQPREALEAGIVDGYREALRRGERLAPVAAARCGDRLLVQDGHHRLAALRDEGRDEAEVEVTHEFGEGGLRPRGPGDRRLEAMEALLACYLSGQVSERQWQEHLREDAELRAWAAARLRGRPASA